MKTKEEILQEIARIEKKGIEIREFNKTCAHPLRTINEMFVVLIIDKLKWVLDENQIQTDTNNKG